MNSNNNNGIKYWTKKEEDDLCHAIKLKRSFERIAADHGRSVKAVQIRFHSILKKRMEKGESLKTLRDQFGMSETEMKNIIAIETPERSTNANSNTLDQSKILERLDKIETIMMKIYKHVKS
jgi:hypothetical protein